jgi:acetyl-CoA acyltransferase
MMRGVYIIGVGMTKFGKWLGRSIKSLSSEAIEHAIIDADINQQDLEAAWFSNSTWGYFSNQQSIRGQVVLIPLGIGGIPIINVENACASASTALHSAWVAVGSGLYECALVIGAEKLYHEDKQKTFNAFFTCIDVENKEKLFKSWEDVSKRFKIKIHAEHGMTAGKGKSAFMDIYAAMSHWHMFKYGSNQRQLAIISSKNHFHGTLNPYAQIQKEMTVEEILQGKLISWPLTLPMCSPVGDGAAAAIVCSQDFLKRKGKKKRAIKLRASILVSGTDRGLEGEDIGFKASKKAYEFAGVDPKDINLAECHDATAYGELHQSEALGFCPLGEGGSWAESGATKLGGKQPLNTSGGLESRGHPIGATGLAQIFELVTQLRGEAGKRQVEGARLALAENGGGNIGYEEAALCINILERV